MADGVSMFDRMWLSLINQRVLDLLLLLYSFVKLSPVLRESQIKIIFRKKLRVDLSHGMLAIIR
jgi:hypothetical protein